MTSRRSAHALVPVLLLVASLLAAASEAPALDDRRAEVPALDSFHEVIFPLWHEAWPNRSFATIRGMLPEVREGVERVRRAELPGILRDRAADWEAGVAALVGAEGRYERAVAALDTRGMLDAVEDLHARFEDLVRVVRPPMKELDAYHVVLYRLYHAPAPGASLREIGEASETLLARCEALRAAPLPRRFAPKGTEIGAGIAALCSATAELREAARGGDVARARASVESVHTEYRKTEALFR